MRTKITTMFAILFITIMASAVSAQTQLATPTVKSPGGVSTTGFTANWTALAALSGATGYDVKIYDASNSLVSTHNAVGETTATLAITGLSLVKNANYTYTVSAIGDGTLKTNSLESAKSIAFYIQTDDKAVFQYITTDASLLRNDLGSAIGASGAADIYELATSGGVYLLSSSSVTNMTLVKNTTLRAKSGLATKPIFNGSTTSSTGSTVNVFTVNAAGLTLVFDGIEFDGTNTTVGGNNRMLIYNNSGANAKIYLTNCYFHDFKQTSGHGVIRMNAASTAAVLDVQNCVFNNCGGKGLNISASAPNTVTVNVKNTTFSNNTVVSNANAIYFSAVNSGTTTIDHCTFYNMISKDASESVFRFSYTVSSVPVGVTIKNSIFDNVANTAVATFDNCYLAGFTGTDPVGTNTFVTAPTYTSAATRDFTLTNLSSLICTDGYVVGNTFGASLTPLLPPTTINDAVSVGVTTFTAGWSEVINASGYLINVYNGVPTLVSSTRVGAVTSTPITGLSASTNYTYKVLAIGDATTYSSSAESSPSNSFTTLPPAPAIASFTPTNAGNGTSVVITGTNFTGASAVSFGGTAANSYTVNNDTQITATVAAGASGSVSVTTPSGTGTKTGFIWLQPVTIISGTKTNADYTFTEESVVNVPNGAILTINALTTVNRITIEGGGKVTNNSTFNVTNTMTINSDGNGTGTYVDLGTSAISGTVNQDLASVRNWYVSSPVATAQSNVLTPLGTLWKYNETNTGVTTNPGTALWDLITTNEALTVMKGYIFKPTSPGLISFTGTLNTGDKSITLDRTENAQAGRGFNLVGNPYPSYLNWMMAIDAANTGTSNMSTTLWYRTKNPGTYVFPTVTAYFVFDTYNATATTGTNNNGGGEVTRMIAPMQSFWVRVKPALDNSTTTGTLKFTNAMRDHESGTNRLKAPSAKNATQQLLRLQVSNATNTDEAILLFNRNASDAIDDFDSQKMSNNNPAIPEIYTTVGTDKLVINGMNTIPLDTPIGLGFVPGSATSFSIKANEVSNLAEDMKVILKDNVTLAETDLTDGLSSYSFSPETVNGNRFSVIFRTSGSTTGLDKGDDTNLMVYWNNNKGITIRTNDEKLIGSTVTVFTALGQQLISKKLSSTSMNVDYPYTPNVYLVKVNNVITKVIIK